jgi:hypothetical protein
LKIDAASTDAMFGAGWQQVVEGAVVEQRVKRPDSITKSMSVSRAILASLPVCYMPRADGTDALCRNSASAG